MKTRTLRNAICLALFVVASGAEEWAMAQERTQEAGGQDGVSTVRDGERVSDKDAATDPSKAVTELQVMTVTGTRIRGGTTPSPVITIGSEQIREEGFSDLGEVIRSVPQNFGGGQNPGVVVGATLGSGGIANQNSAGASALNLRGLGPDATLTLLNGRRLAYSGFAQAVDISAIPVEAVDRVEIVPDGASAIYGSDAVGGVGNVILRRDYDGVTVGARYGAATEGGLGTWERNVTAGTAWGSGGLIATYQSTSIDPVLARQRDYSDYMFDPTTLYPGSRLRSGLVSLHQSLGDVVEFQLDALRTLRRQETFPHNTGLAPFYYRIAASSATSMVSPSLRFYLPADWVLSINGSWSKDRSLQKQAAVMLATGVPTTVFHSCSCNDASSYEIEAEGSLFSLPGGDVRLAVGAGGRRGGFVQTDYLAGTKYADGDESSRFAYAELSVPLVGKEQGMAGVRRLDLTAALRGEDHDSFGRVATPKFGLIYAPDDDFTFKASWGKSFKAPTLFQLYQTRNAGLDPASFYGWTGHDANATVLSLNGGNPDLAPERATTWALTSVFHPQALPGFQTELTWFNIDYRDRVIQPITDYAHALARPEYDQFIIRAPSAQAMSGVLDASNAFYNFTGRPYDPEDVVAIIYGQYVNVSRQHVRGFDLSSRYQLDTDAGTWVLQGSATWLDSKQQGGVGQDAFAISGTLFNPAKFRARAGMAWSRGGWMASTFLNHVGAVTDTVRGHGTGSFDTFDATLRYAIEAKAGAMSGVELALSAQNLFDRHPPLYVPGTADAPPYDSTNYSAIGRFVSLSVSKHW